MPELKKLKQAELMKFREIFWVFYVKSLCKKIDVLEKVVVFGILDVTDVVVCTEVLVDVFEVVVDKAIF